MEQNEFYKQLVDRYVRHTATDEELEVFFHLLQRGKLDNYLSDDMKSEAERISIKEISRAPVRKLPVWMRIAAASIILFLIAGILYFSNRESAEGVHMVKKETPVHDIAPGTNKAILTLADGTQIILDSAHTGAISQQGNVTVIKLNDGQIAYNTSSPSQPSTLNPQPSSLTYNTITTPRGGQYQLILADGSKVWLNAASSLRFPNVFSGEKRVVTLTGEGYFEIAHNAEKPFFVQVGDMEVKVLGTHFNINAYQDEAAVRTTLLEGEVKMITKGETAILKPGQQAQITNGTSHIRVNNNANLGAVVAWKNGLFDFHEANIPTIMRQLARWYNIEVEYRGYFSDKRFNGKLYRNVPLSQVLKILKAGGINFEFEGNKLIVSMIGDINKQN